MPAILRLVLALILLAGIGAGLPVLAQQPAQQAAQQSTQPPATGMRAEIAARLATGRADLVRIEKTLERQDLSDPALQGLRGDLDPVARIAREAADEITPRLAAVKTRLEQLGPKPDDKAPPENATVTDDRKQQQQIFDDLDAQLKQARLLGVDADDVTDRIVSRRRALFARAVFSRSYSILDLGLWSSAIREVPADARATATIATDWLTNVWRRLGPAYGMAFLAFLLAVGAFYVYAASAVRRLLAREPATAEPSRLAKVLGAFLVVIVISIVPILCAFAIAGSLHLLGLVPDRIDPLLKSLVGAVTRISLTAGVARGLLTPSRQNWRLLDLRDVTCDRLIRLALTIALIVSAGKVLDAIFDLIAASLPVAVATRGLVSWAVVITMALSLRGILPEEDDAECLGPKIGGPTDWYGPLRIAAWTFIAVTFVAVLVGYVAFGAFLVDQLVWVSFIGALLYLLRQLAAEGTAAAMRPQALVGRGFVTSVGLRRESLDFLAALITGIAGLALWIVAALLVLAPWGIESDDMFGSLQAAFFGFRIGDVTISLSSIVLSFIIFGIGLGLTRALQKWLDQSLLPLTQLDTGLRNSIRTSLGYVGFTLALALALGEVGLDFQKLAIVAGALSVGIGFGLQSIVNNFVSGLIILWERAIRVGDWVVVGEEQGHVRRINVRSTEIETFDRATMIVPNSNLVSGVVKNWVRGDRIGRIRIPLAVPLDTDADVVRDTLVACARAQDNVLRIPAPQVWLAAIGTTDLKFELMVYVGDVEATARVKSDLNFEILKRFKAEKIALAPAAAPPTVVNINGLERLERLVERSEREDAGR